MKRFRAENILLCEMNIVTEIASNESVKSACVLVNIKHAGWSKRCVNF